VALSVSCLCTHPPLTCHLSPLTSHLSICFLCACLQGGAAARTVAPCLRCPLPPNNENASQQTPCRETLLGTDSGALYELSLEVEGKKERLRQLHELRGEAGPIAGLAQVCG